MSSIFEQAKKKKQLKKSKEQKRLEEEKSRSAKDQELVSMKEQKAKEEFSDDDEVQAPIVIGGSKVKDIKDVKKAQSEKNIEKKVDPS